MSCSSERSRKKHLEKRQRPAYVLAVTLSAKVTGVNNTSRLFHSCALAALLVASSTGTLLPSDESGSHCCTVTIRARVPPGIAKVYLAGNLPQLGPWRPDAIALTGTGEERTG